jgi:hypothetical protein
VNNPTLFHCYSSKTNCATHFSINVTVPARALEADWACVAAGLDVGWFDAVSERHRYRTHLIGGAVGEHPWAAGAVDGVVADSFDCLTLAIAGDDVLVTGCLDRLVVE